LELPNVKESFVIPRPLWTARLEEAWTRAPVAWLSGVRRVGKTTLARSLADIHYVNCDLPSAVARLADPELFLASIEHSILVLDEVHQLDDPSRLLKIAADTAPKLRVLATGSSTLAATRKFRDALTGRKREVHLLPVLADELPAFGVADLDRRLLRGGLPQALLAAEHDSGAYQEWLDSYFARDVQELFRVDKRGAFLRLLETLMRQSGGMLDVTSLARACDLSRPTAMTYLDVLEVTHAIHVLRPYHGGGSQELVRQAKVYAFDTGFVAHSRGWRELRPDDRGQLWEHLVLDTLRSVPAQPRVHFWRDKQQREIDFVVPRGRGLCDAIECKWSADRFEPRGLRAFRALHPRGRNFVVTPARGEEGYTRMIDGREVRYVGTAELRREMAR
jgi:uncharacterized protein